MDLSEAPASITLVYVRPTCEQETELDRLMTAEARRYGMEKLPGRD